MMNKDGVVFIVEDTADIRQLLASLLQAEGFTVDCADNGETALQALRGAAAPPKVILLDLMMPVMDGYEFLEEWRKDTQLSKIPVVLMSADVDVSNKARKYGVTTHLKKPFLNLNEILETVGQYF